MFARAFFVFEFMALIWKYFPDPYVVDSFAGVSLAVILFILMEAEMEFAITFDGSALLITAL